MQGALDAVILQVSHLYKSYAADCPVLQGASLTGRAGQICGVIGGVMGHPRPGKSTLVRILSGAIAPDYGELTLRVGAGIYDLRSHASTFVAWVPQSPAVVADLTAADNVFLGREMWRFGGVLADTRRQRRALDLWSSILFSLPEGPAKLWAHSPEQIMKVAILRAVVTGRPVLVIDEGTAALPDNDRGRFYSFLRRFADEGNIVVLVASDLSDLTEACDCVFALVHGELLLVGGDATQLRKLARDTAWSLDAFVAGRSSRAQRRAYHPSLT